MKVHFIAIGGSAMHNLAIALCKKGYRVSGSDDEIFEPARSRLASYGLLPLKEGWFDSNISKELDAVILGMHAKPDNPELLKAKKLGLKIFSYPEYLYEQSKNKTRIVIGGSHGKTTITAMILHVLNICKIECDYMVGAQLEGFEVMVKLSETAEYMILEGDEYLSSPDDRRPKFHLYKPDIALLSGIAWDHINVFPTFENYIEQFRIFLNLISPGGYLIYNSDDRTVKETSEKCNNDITKIPYTLPLYNIENGITYLITKSVNQQITKFSLKIFGKHNLSNINGAMQVCSLLGVSEEDFCNAITTFKGASKRLELVAQNDNSAIYKDFAHSPSKLSATIDAVKEQFPSRRLIACLELHTYSSLSKEFLPLYAGTMNHTDNAIVYFSNHALELKKLPPITHQQIMDNFKNNKLIIFTDSAKLQDYLLKSDWKNSNLLMMSSGNFDGINLPTLADKLLTKN